MDDSLNDQNVPPDPSSRSMNSPSGQAGWTLLPPWRAYTLAVVLTASTLLLRFAFGFRASEQPAFVMFVIPILLSAYVGGLGPGLLSTLTAGVLAAYYLLPGEHTLIHSVVSLLLVGTLVSVLTESLHRSRLGWGVQRKASLALSGERKIQISFAFALVLLILIGAVSYRGVGQLSENSASVEQAQKLIASIQSLLSMVTDAETAQRGYTLTGNEGSLKPYKAALRQLDDKFQELRGLTRNDVLQQRRLAILDPLVTKRMDLSREVIEVRRSQGFRAAQRLTAAGNGKQIHDQIRDLVAEIQKTEEEALDARQSRARRSATMTRAVIVAGTAIGFIVVAIALFLIGQDFAGNRQAEAALRKAHDELEARVQERTAELEHSNESLREAEAVLRTVTDAAHVGLAIIDQERRCRYANPGYSEILDLPAEEIVGQRLAHVRAPGDAETVPDRLEAAFGGEHVNFELSVPPAAPGDTERYYAVSYEPATSRWGKVVIIVMMDMTERKRAQLTLSRYRLLAGQTRDIILFTREDGQIMEANDAAVKTYGYDYETLLSKSIYDLGADLTFPVVDQQMTAADRAGLRFETIHRREDGSRFPVDVTSVGADFGGERLLLSIIRDITDRKRTEEELRQQAALLDLAPVFVRDLASRVVLWGQGAQQLYGYSREEALGQISHELLRSEFPVPLAEIEDTLKRQGSWEGELTHRTRDGSRMVVSSHWVLYYDTRGIATHVMEVNTDVTLRKEVEEDIKKWNLRLEERVKERTAELREAKERAELADRVKSEFLANMSHELRTPLNAVIGFSELLTDQKPGPLNSQQQDFLNEILMSGRHLLSLINDILDLTRITAGKIDLQPRALSVSAAVRESCSTIKPIASEKNILVKVKTDSKNDIVNLDELRLKQVLYNLLSNAVKFTPQNGKIRVAASVDDQKRIRIRVKDTGIGINEEDLPRLFGVFQQGDSGFAKRQQGSGLGLALTKKIVELQNGAITVESEPGKGSTFTVVLPSNAHVEGEAAVS